MDYDFDLHDVVAFRGCSLQYGGDDGYDCGVVVVVGDVLAVDEYNGDCGCCCCCYYYYYCCCG